MFGCGGCRFSGLLHVHLLLLIVFCSHGNKKGKMTDFRDVFQEMSLLMRLVTEALSLWIGFDFLGDDIFLVTIVFTETLICETSS